MAYNQSKNPFSKNPLNFNSPLNSFKSLVGKLMNQGKSKEAATKIAGKVANAKMKGAGSGPTAAQKARAKGSAAKMEDLSGDGKVTKKDVLIGRGVIEKDGSPAKAHDKKLKALEERIKKVRQSEEGSEGQGGIDYELLAQLENQKKKLIESHGKKAKETAKPSPASLKSPVEHHSEKFQRNQAVSSVKGEGIKEVKGEDSKLELKESAKRLTQADLDANKSTAKSKGIVSSEGRDGTNRQERKKRRQERRKIRKSKDLSSTQKRMAVKESRQQQKDNVRGVKKESPAKKEGGKTKHGYLGTTKRYNKHILDQQHHTDPDAPRNEQDPTSAKNKAIRKKYKSPAKFHEPKDAAHGDRKSHRSGETRKEIMAKQQARAEGTQQGKSPAKNKFKPSQAGARAMVAARKKNVKEKPKGTEEGLAKRRSIIKKVKKIAKGVRKAGEKFKKVAT